MASIKYCEMCFDARLCQMICDKEEEECTLTDENDLSYISIGEMSKEHSMFIASGGGRPVRLIVQKVDEVKAENMLVGIYYPKYCPNCGRKLTEYGG